MTKAQRASMKSNCGGIIYLTGNWDTENDYKDGKGSSDCVRIDKTHTIYRYEEYGRVLCLISDGVISKMTLLTLGRVLAV